MDQGTRLLKTFLLALFLGCCLGLELQSEESTLPRTLAAVIQLGKQLKLFVGGNVQSPAEYRWLVNGTSVSEKCDVTRTDAGSTLVCSDMDWSDEGLYEHQRITNSGQKEVLLAVRVTVVECIKSDKLQVKLVESVTQKSVSCFCSGITEECEMADNLYRSRIAISLSDSDMVHSRWSNGDVRLPLKYYSLPKKLKGNLLMSYGGFLDIPPIDDGIDPDSPEVVLLGNNMTLVYHHKRELEISGELNRKRIQMVEHDWRQLDGSYVPSDTFKTVLSNVAEFYVKSRPPTGLESLQVVLDSADSVDQEMGKVTTVETCECRVGYTGLSCERCSSGYTRRYAIGLQGVCVSLKELWDELKLSARRHHYQRYSSQYRS